MICALLERYSLFVAYICCAFPTLGKTESSLWRKITFLDKQNDINYYLHHQIGMCSVQAGKSCTSAGEKVSFLS